MPRRILYPASFIQTVPVPERWDYRPLPGLIHRANPEQRDKEIERLEAWYRTLNSGAKTDLKHRLRSLSFRDFWSAYYELMTAQIALGLRATSVRHAPLLKGKRPDFRLKFSPGSRHIWEVAAAYQTLERESDDYKAHELANWLNRTFQHRWSVLVDAEQFGHGGVSYSAAKPKIQAWLNRLEHGGPRLLELRQPVINCQLRLTASSSQLRDEPGPIVRALMGQGGNLTATERLRNALRKKVKKYSVAKNMNIPLVVFLYEGNFGHISREDVEWALFGQWHISIPSGRLGVDPGGLFMPAPNGNSQNTRLSAVVYCRREWKDNAVHATMFIYHHPAARNCIPLDFFSPLPQCRIIIRDTELEQIWENGPEGEIKIFRLD